MSVLANRVRRGFYLDSVALMRMSAALNQADGVEEAVLMVGTPSNVGIMEEAGLLDASGRGAGPDDLVIAVRAADEGSLDACLEHAARLLEGDRGRAEAEAYRPRSLDGALAGFEDANLALVSTPGEYAAREAHAALARGLNVMIFSDNVPVDEERALKEEAARRGLLLMGPDCGTAYIGGLPLAFANRVPAGQVGVVAASGTGLQEFAVLLSRLGAGVRHGIGVGGRDLSDAVGALSTLAAIDLLASDPLVSHLVLLSKPPGAATAALVFERLAAAGKPVTACVFGLESSAIPDAINAVPTLKAAAESAAGAKLAPLDAQCEAAVREKAAALAPSRRLLRGLFCGGTLCTEAQAVLHAAGVAVSSNAPLADTGNGPESGSVLDLGADEYTRGRPHPMIEPALRSPLLDEALRDPEVAVVLLDVVLGYGSHPDPAASVAACVAGAGADRPVVVASVCGTPGDPQDVDLQVRTLREAGVVVAPSNADAAALAARILVARQ